MKRYVHVAPAYNSHSLRSTKTPMLFDTQTATANAAVAQLQADANTLIDTLDQEIATANAQIAADQTTIATANAALASTQSTLTTTQQSLAIVQKQLTALQSISVYDRLE